MKLSWLSETLIGSEIVKLGNEINERKAKGETIYNFTIGDFDPKIFRIPAEYEAAIIQAYKDGFTNYPPADGTVDLRTAVGQHLNQHLNLNYSNKEILIASGGRPLIYAAYRAVVDKGDKVIYAAPSWNNNHYTHFTEGAHVVVEALPENKFMPTAAQIAPHLKGAALLALCSPLNPTGTMFTKEALQEICALVVAENASRPANEKKLYVIYDQIYWSLTFGDNVHYTPVGLEEAMRPYTIFIDGVSKVFAATGVRVGWCLAPEFVINKMKAILSHVGAWAPMAEQKATAKYLQQKESIAAFLKEFKPAIAKRLELFHNGLQQLKTKGYAVDSIAPQGALYLTIKIDLVGQEIAGKTFIDQQEVTSYLLGKAQLAIVPFSAFGASKDSSWYRVSVGTCTITDIENVLLALENALAGTKVPQLTEA
jgi:aspartate aminotransferase